MNDQETIEVIWQNLLVSLHFFINLFMITLSLLFHRDLSSDSDEKKFLENEGFFLVLWSISEKSFICWFWRNQLLEKISKPPEKFSHYLKYQVWTWLLGDFSTTREISIFSFRIFFNKKMRILRKIYQKTITKEKSCPKDPWSS